MGSAFDIAVVGGGMSGMTAALALGEAGFDVALVEREASGTMLGDAFDGRVSSIAWGSKLVLERLGAWEAVGENAQPILGIRVSDRHSPLFLHYDHRDVGDHPLGWIMENRVLRRALDSAVSRADRVHRIEGEVVAMERGHVRSAIGLREGAGIECRLIVACDGARSPLRAMAGIGAWRHDYRQKGVVATVRHERPHRSIAHERFLAGGPFAILPLPGNLSSLVWTEKEAIADRVLELERQDFAEEVAWRFGDFLGRLEVLSPVWSHPLGLVIAGGLVARRLVLLGDAAHAVHPIAGQGFNLAIRDAAVLAEILADARRLGLDPGTGGLLEAYARRRRVDTMMLVTVTHGLNRLFTLRSAPAALARGLGLAAVNRMPPLKRFLMRDAMGIAGRLPRLMSGENL